MISHGYVIPEDGKMDYRGEPNGIEYAAKKNDTYYIFKLAIYHPPSYGFKIHNDFK